MIQQRITREKRTVSAMIRLYCRTQHRHKRELCGECQKLEHYAHMRVDHCRYESSKPICGKCTAPCYAPEKRRQIRQVMRRTRLRMVFAHPLLTAFHLKDAFSGSKTIKK
ncbi:MAG: nitrous oxide-stimulated promoter family protein [Bacillota bacterium]|nr:nitrous oxide-stimulated promoter family protein [Bacillota bacterium]MDW7677906.1 nitrous oxide-stimulated promoter family protein [Bacillota bacterium]